MELGYTIGEVARQAGVNVETIRYYQRRMLFPTPQRLPGGTRRYSGAEVVRLRFIKSAQRLGFTLSEVEGLLELLEPMSCSKTRKVAAAKLELINERIQELSQLRNEFTRLLAACDTNSDESRCPIIERLAR